MFSLLHQGFPSGWRPMSRLQPGDQVGCGMANLLLNVHANINFIVWRLKRGLLMWSVCVVGGWFTASPGLSQTDWSLGLGGAAYLWCRAIMAPRMNQISTHTLRRESLCHGSMYYLPGVFHLTISNKCILQLNITEYVSDTECVWWLLVYPGCHDCSAPQPHRAPESNQSDSGQGEAVNQLSTTHPPHTLYNCILSHFFRLNVTGMYCLFYCIIYLVPGQKLPGQVGRVC